MKKIILLVTLSFGIVCVGYHLMRTEPKGSGPLASEASRKVEPKIAETLVNEDVALPAHDEIDQLEVAVKQTNETLKAITEKMTSLHDKIERLRQLEDDFDHGRLSNQSYLESRAEILKEFEVRE